MRIRAYTPDDFAALYAIEELCFEPRFRFSRSYMKRLLGAPNAAAWVAEDDGTPAGFAIVEWSPGASNTSAYIQTIEVAPAFRRRGIGVALLSRCEESALASGAELLWLHVADKNAEAIQMYECAGYQRIDTEEHYYAPERHAYLYRKSLVKG
jgi:ribosomal-protein-alanine N-acetyltransferase